MPAPKSPLLSPHDSEHTACFPPSIRAERHRFLLMWLWSRKVISVCPKETAAVRALLACHSRHSCAPRLFAFPGSSDTSCDHSSAPLGHSWRQSSQRAPQATYQNTFNSGLFLWKKLIKVRNFPTRNNSLRLRDKITQVEQAAHEHIHCAKAVVTRNSLLSHPLLKLGFAVKLGGNKLKTVVLHPPGKKARELSAAEPHRGLLFARGNWTVSQKHRSSWTAENKPAVLSEAPGCNPGGTEGSALVQEEETILILHCPLFHLMSAHSSHHCPCCSALLVEQDSPGKQPLAAGDGTALLSLP